MNNYGEDNAWRQVLQAAHTLADACPGAVFIGGLAVYLHTQNRALGKLPVSREQLAEFSHDVDTYISLLDLGALRDMYEVIANERLHKHQVKVGGIEADIYVEHNNKLRVPYTELVAWASAYGSMKVAAIGHLQVLKLDAAAGRTGTSKGDKDTRDLVKMSVLASDEDQDLFEPYLDSRGLARLKEVGASPSVFTSITRGNALHATQLRGLFNAFIDRLRERTPGDDDQRPARSKRSRRPKNTR
ncbi:MAG TPA: hypothetical protein VNI53_00680 [Gammaproteobacteria bacterium]|nr:hypothetical protein [Gammaproteobacteria bacterium]